MKKITIVVLGIMFFAPLSFGEENGEALFKSMGCMSCHHPETTSKINPSLTDIAQAYQGKPQQLAGYLNGQGAAVVKPEKAGMMKRYVEKTKALTDPERAALADFILAHQQ
ncbi:c-type cytochrome [uncultured Desulfosarcina sp.]|uniref:c-type cytochrome n=1 Tax=uncultured Desulfosarcina sp. TaxID=218289 RepID=UPI0029C8F184|nr:c-type cytochrome [uncultured Desulfosarcina sp.]